MSIAKIFVVSDQELFRNGVISLVQDDNNFEVVGEASRVVDVTESIKQTSPDLIIRDLYNVESEHDFFHKSSGSQDVATKSIVFTAASTDFELVRYVHAGVTGILNRNIGRVELLKAIHEVLAGRVYYCSETTNRLTNNIRNTTLTKRELEILQHLAMGLSNKELAKRLRLQVGTVKTHLINIIAKLDVSSRTGAVVRGLQQKLIRI